MPFFFSELTFFFVALLFPSHSAVSCDCKSRDVRVGTCARAPVVYVSCSRGERPVLQRTYRVLTERCPSFVPSFGQGDEITQST